MKQTDYFAKVSNAWVFDGIDGETRLKELNNIAYKIQKWEEECTEVQTHLSFITASSDSSAMKLTVPLSTWVVS